MNDKVRHEFQSYKMSLEASSVQSFALERAKGSSQEIRSETSSRLHKTRDSEARVSETDLKSLISLRKVENMNHISLVNLLPLVIRRLFSLCSQVKNGMS